MKKYLLLAIHVLVSILAIFLVEATVQMDDDYLVLGVFLGLLNLVLFFLLKRFARLN